MLALLSPAKTLDYASPLPEWIAPTSPPFEAEAQRIARAAARLDATDLERLMGISEKLATLNVDRYRRFAKADTRPAIYAFAGDVYTGFEARTLDEPAILFAQDHVRILSGLYGLLRPLDAIRPYRLEMGTRWAPAADTLYAHWGARLSRHLTREMARDGTRVIVNLASKEYWHAIEQAPPKGSTVIAIEFLDDGPKGRRFNSFAAKKARGMMARYLCEHRLARVDDLRGFDSDGYVHDAKGSDEHRWRFVRRRRIV